MMHAPAIVLVVRSSVSDGLGHLVRSLCVAKELALFTKLRLVNVGDGAGAHLLAESGIEWVGCVDDTSAAYEVIRDSPGLCIFDTLVFESGAFAKIAATSLTVSLSPAFSNLSEVDYLIHRTQREDPRWALERATSFPYVHKGLEFTILPRWLKRISSKTFSEQAREERLAVAISMGGSDASNRTLALLNLLGECSSPLVVFVSLGDAYTHSYEELLRCAQSNRQEIILVKSNESMWRVLRNASLLVCAGGLTTYEAAYIGIPSINVLHRAEWGYLFEELTESGACITLPPGEDCLALAARQVSALSVDRTTLLSMHAATKDLIPNGGAKRVAKLLCKLNISTQSKV